MNTWSWIDRLLPPLCLLCGSPAGHMHNLCDACKHDLPFMPATRCIRCALPLPRSGTCGQCLQRSPAFATTIAALRYEGYSETLVHRFKFSGDQAAGKVLAAVLAQRVSNVERPDVLLPVPLSKQRLRLRGFNQSRELARRLAKILSLSEEFAAVRRISEHVPQSSLSSWDARRRNVDNVFHVKQGRVNAKHIAIIDDVMTSGATANSLARQLINAGARRVDVWVSCRAGVLSKSPSGVQVGY